VLTTAHVVRKVEIPLDQSGREEHSDNFPGTTMTGVDDFWLDGSTCGGIDAPKSPTTGTESRLVIPIRIVATPAVRAKRPFLKSWNTVSQTGGRVSSVGRSGRNCGIYAGLINLAPLALDGS
jgi:hypothetical protein